MVLEVPAQAGGDVKRFAEIIEALRRRGFLIALDGFGAKQSNVDRVWQLRPDIVTLERGIVRQATEQPTIRRVLPGLVSLLHESGRLVLMGGLETEGEALIALECNADFVQGSYFAGAGLNAADPLAAAGIIDTLTATLRRQLVARAARERARLAPYAQALETAAGLLVAGEPLGLACAALLSLPDTARCFLLDGAGRQNGDNLVPRQRASQRANRFMPLVHSEGASWERRPYFVDALAEPGRVRATRPYLSINEAHLCITVSIAMTPAVTVTIGDAAGPTMPTSGSAIGPAIGGMAPGTRVLCVDIDWEAHNT